MRLLVIIIFGLLICLSSQARITEFADPLKSSKEGKSTSFTNKAKQVWGNLINKIGSIYKDKDGGEKAKKTKKALVKRSQPLVPKKTVLFGIEVEKVESVDFEAVEAISRNDFVDSKFRLAIRDVKSLKALPTPRLLTSKKYQSWLKRKSIQVKEPRKVERKSKALDALVTEEKIRKISLGNLKFDERQARDVRKFNSNQLKMLAALLIFNQKNKCHMVTGIFDEMSKIKGYEDEANFYIGICSHNMGLFSEALQRLEPIIAKAKKPFHLRAINQLLDNLPSAYQMQLAKLLISLKDKSKIAGKALHKSYYIIAKYEFKSGRYIKAQKWLANIPADSEFYPLAHYVKAISLHAQRKFKQSEQSMQELKLWIDKNGTKDKKLKNLVYINLARMKFRNEKYNEAVNNYKLVEKDYSLWVQGLMEQGWSQVQSSDYSGAIGNMYSLHSPYFTAVYKLDSYVIRTIGYLNICQYGDAYRSLTELEKLHRNWVTGLKNYLKQDPRPIENYQTVATYLKGKSTSDVKGLAYQLIREVARQRNYLNYQDMVNDKVDEVNQYNFVYRMIKKDQNKLRKDIKSSKSNYRRLIASLKQVKKGEDPAKHENLVKIQLRRERSDLKAMKFQLALYEKSRVAFVNFTVESKSRVETESVALQKETGRVIFQNLVALDKHLERALDNNEFLRYEVFAGSGENIRYQMAGGQTIEKRRLPSTVKPSKSLKWDFDGEYWSDEIGAYRSSLKDNCPVSRLHKADNGKVKVKEN